VTVTIKDTVLVSKPDSLYYNAYIECVNNKPVIRDPEQKNSKNIKADIKLQDGKLSINVKTEAQNLFLKWKETYEKQHSGSVKNKPVPYPVIKEVPTPIELTKWEQVYMHFGKIMTWLFIGGVLIFLSSLIPWKALFRL